MSCTCVYSYKFYSQLKSYFLLPVSYINMLCVHFEHACRVCYLAGEFARSLKANIEADRPEPATEDENKLWKFSDEEVICAEIAGLCHDLGTII